MSIRKEWVIIIAMLLAIMAAPAVGAGEKVSWTAFTSEAGGFSVSFPGQPTATHPSVETVVGKIGENIFKLNTPTVDFSVEYSDLPGIAVDFESDDDLYTKAKNNMLKAIGAVETAFQSVTIENRPGKELSFRIAGTEKVKAASGKARFLLVDKRLYVLSVSTTSEEHPAIERFLNSFKLLQRK